MVCRGGPHTRLRRDDDVAMQTMSNRVRTHAVHLRDRKMDNASVGGVQWLEADLPPRRTHLGGQGARFVDQMGFATHPILTNVDDDAHVVAELARSQAPNDVLERRESLTATADEQPIQTVGSNMNVCGVVDTFRFELGRNSHRFQEILDQVAEILVGVYESFDADADAGAASLEQPEEARGPGFENLEANLSALYPERVQRLFERLVHACARCLDPMVHDRLPFAAQSPVAAWPHRAVLHTFD